MPTCSKGSSLRIHPKLVSSLSPLVQVNADVGNDTPLLSALQSRCVPGVEALCQRLSLGVGSHPHIFFVLREGHKWTHEIGNPRDAKANAGQHGAKVSSDCLDELKTISSSKAGS